MKRITSLSLGISFLIMSYTGIMLFLAPHGRVAYWSDWHLFGLSKTQYGEIHSTSMLVFLFFGIWHVYYNWKSITNYLKDKTKKISFTKKEFLTALLLNLIFILGTLYYIQPFKAFLDFGEEFKDSWAKEYGEPPYGHAELTKLRLFCKKLKIDLREAKRALEKNKIIFDENDSLKEIAIKNFLTPNDIYKIIKPSATENKSDDVPSRLGQKTLQDLSDLKKIDLEKAIKYLESKGIKDVTPQSRTKELANELDLTPMDIYKELSIR